MTWIYHITDKRNLPGILTQNGLYSKNKEKELRAAPVKNRPANNESDLLERYGTGWR